MRVPRSPWRRTSPPVSRRPRDWSSSCSKHLNRVLDTIRPPTWLACTAAWYSITEIARWAPHGLFFGRPTSRRLAGRTSGHDRQQLGGARSIVLRKTTTTPPACGRSSGREQWRVSPPDDFRVDRKASATTAEGAAYREVRQSSPRRRRDPPSVPAHSPPVSGITCSTCCAADGEVGTKYSTAVATGG